MARVNKKAEDRSKTSPLLLLDLGKGGRNDDIGGLETVSAGAVRMLPVAAPGHPLARKGHRERASDHI